MNNTTVPPGARSFISAVQHPLKFSLYLLWKLPSAWLAGVRVKSLQPESCTTVVPYRWLSQNPFRSTYFACLGMAAEMSTGLLALLHMRAFPDKRISVLVTGIQADFVKKATSKTWFTCEEGNVLESAVQHAAETGEPVTVTVNSIGKSSDGTVIASFAITWSFKAKS